MKELKNVEGLIISFLFIVLSYLFSRGFFHFFFIMIIVLLLIIAFLREANRILCWIMMAYFGGTLMVFYIDNFLSDDVKVPFYRSLTNELLGLIPILFTVFVIKKFKHNISPFLKFPRFNVLVRTFVVSFFLVLSLMIWVESDAAQLTALLVYVIIRAALQEVFWRGILLTHVSKVTNNHTGIMITGVLFGLNTTLFGFSLELFILNVIMGILLGYITIKIKSIIPAIFAHVMMLIVFYLNEWLILPI